MANMLKIPTTGPVAAIIVPLELNAGVVSLPTTPEFIRFNNLGKGSGLTIPASEASTSTNDEYIIWETNDWKKIRYKKSIQTYEGLTGDAVSEADASSNTPSQIDIVSNDIPEQSPTAITDHYAWLMREEDLRAAPSLVVLDLGKGPDTITRNNIGFALTIGYLSSERKVQVDGSTPYQLSLSFKAAAFSIEATSETTMKGAGWLGDVTPVKASSPVTFPDITQAALDRLKAGKYALIQ